ncbi:hypothetical protein BKA70DRAFT_1214177 [Coprinopsis sp. MPI-PUGE-AT-0042]|nr:hypothetical protein BKA70DRAFT_1214177 [Coprinopsis sp. MPI-PUGE-AT-0042]
MYNMFTLKLVLISAFSEPPPMQLAGLLSLARSNFNSIDHGVEEQGGGSEAPLELPEREIRFSGVLFYLTKISLSLTKTGVVPVPTIREVFFRVGKTVSKASVLRVTSNSTTSSTRSTTSLKAMSLKGVKKIPVKDYPKLLQELQILADVLVDAYEELNDARNIFEHVCQEWQAIGAPAHRTLTHHLDQLQVGEQNRDNMMKVLDLLQQCDTIATVPLVPINIAVA